MSTIGFAVNESPPAGVDDRLAEAGMVDSW